VGSLFVGKPPLFAFYEMGRASSAIASFHEYLRDLGLANSASSAMLVALWAISNWAAPSIISTGSLAVQETLLNASLHTVVFEVIGIALSTVWDRKWPLVHN
jgi:hypothetical protein